jgi:ATP-dependent helicase/nuclease subunit A
MSEVLVKPDRQRRAADPAHSSWVAASAGTGKTSVLVDRIQNLLLNGTKPPKILCLTFTKAAAKEMVKRLMERLGEWVTLRDDQLVAHIQALTGTKPDEKRLERARRLFA